MSPKKIRSISMSTRGKNFLTTSIKFIQRNKKVSQVRSSWGGRSEQGRACSGLLHLFPNSHTSKIHRTEAENSAHDKKDQETTEKRFLPCFNC